MKVLCIGEALIDMICTDQGKSLEAGTTFVKKTGGAPGNVAAAIASLGGDAAMAAKVGNDPFGIQLIAELNSFGVDTRWVLKDDKNFTTLAFVSLMEDGERDFVFNRGADAALSPADIENIYLGDVGIAHFGSATAFLPGELQQAYYYLLEKCKLQNLFVSFDPNYRSALFENDKSTFIHHSLRFLQHCNFFKVSEEEAMMIAGTDSLEDATSRLRQLSPAPFAITLGSQGTLFCLSNNKMLVPSVSIKPVDTTGAGDAFVGSVLFQLSKLTSASIIELTKTQWQIIISEANKVAAKTCLYHGAMEAFRHLKTGIADEK